MGLPSGLLWSPVNIDESQPGGFAESPYMYEASFFSWGNVDGHKPTSPSSFSPWNWGESNPQEPYYEGQVYGSTPGSLLESDIPLTNDIANRLFGAGWRIPSSADFEELIANCDFIDANGNIIVATDKRVVINGIMGIRLKSRLNGAVIFFATTGRGVGTIWDYRGLSGFYWSSSYVNTRVAKVFILNNEAVSPDSSGARFCGFPIRPVFDASSV